MLKPRNVGLKRVKPENVKPKICVNVLRYEKHIFLFFIMLYGHIEMFKWRLDQKVACRRGLATPVLDKSNVNIKTI